MKQQHPPLPLPTGETRWIEAESLETPDPTNDNRIDQESSVVDGGLDSLFADPDPYETFTSRWKLRGDCNGTDTDICITVTGHKAENGQTLHSTGLTLWRASTILSNWLVEEHNHQQHANSGFCGRRVTGKTVLELGAGLGVCGLTAHKLGASHTVLTDGDSDALKNLRHNVAANIEHSRGHNNCRCEQLVWGNSAHIQRILDAYGQFDVIMGADIIYVDCVVEPLFHTVQLLMRAHGVGVFLLAYARRNVKIDYVLAVARERGFTWTIPDATEGVYEFRL